MTQGTAPDLPILDVRERPELRNEIARLNGLDNKTMIPEVGVDGIRFELQKRPENLRIADKVALVGIPTTSKIASFKRMKERVAEHPNQFHAELCLPAELIAVDTEVEVMLVARRLHPNGLKQFEGKLVGREGATSLFLGERHSESRIRSQIKQGLGFSD
jgi:hypothetical protein